MSVENATKIVGYARVSSEDLTYFQNGKTIMTKKLRKRVTQVFPEQIASSESARPSRVGQLIRTWLSALCKAVAGSKRASKVRTMQELIDMPRDAEKDLARWREKQPIPDPIP